MDRHRTGGCERLHRRAEDGLLPRRRRGRVLLLPLQPNGVYDQPAAADVRDVPDRERPVKGRASSHDLL